MKLRLKIGLLILLFALTALPFAATFALYYPDERHYTDGALMMMQHGDWLVPHTDKGRPRFQKPPLAYWAVAASYVTFGVSAFTSRLPFLLVGGGTLWLTYRLARRLTGSVETGLLAAMILVSNPQFFLCSIRSIPDVLLVSCITLSAYGFLRLLVLQDSAVGAFWMAYGGAAGAALSKGLLGVGIVAFAWAFAGWRAHDWRAIKKLIHLPSLAFAVVLAGTWFGYIFCTQGAAALKSFFGDQVTGNFHGHWWFVFGRAPLFALILIFNFLPWSATVVEWFIRVRARAAGGLPLPAQQFIIVWTVLLIAGFALGVNVSLRYLLPATPLLAVLLADWLQSAESARLVLSLQRILKIVLAVLALAVLTGLYVDSQWRLPAGLVWLLGGGLLVGLAVLGWSTRRRKSLSVPEALGLALMLGWVIFFTTALPVLTPDRARQLATALRQSQADPRRPVLLVGDVRLAGRLRVLLGRDWTVTQANRLEATATRDYTRVLVPESAAAELVNRGWTVQTAAVSYTTPPRGELWEGLKSRRLPELLARHAQKICLATRD